ncbi:hypothetical protein WAF17_01390 [Bernardetia sp. ABR2-2B]|uniref:hypothetical protein n=1 Tax=Bernardetia sp. ABR2-2B TaxID=3127472 RepID=UPI0030CA7140
MEDKIPFGIFDYSEFPPLIQVELTGTKATDENFTAYLAEMEKIATQPERYISILDTTKASYLPVKYRIMQGKYLEKNKKHTAQKAIAAVFIAPSFIQRTVLKAIFMIKPYASPVFIVASKEDARQKVEELLEEELMVA